jgi:flavodoxin
MKVLIVYDTVSSTKLTLNVAETIGQVLREKGFEVDSFFVGDAGKTAVANYDCLVAGGPTMTLKVSRGIAEFLDGLKGDFSGKCAAAFGTQLESWMSGSAAKEIDGKLKKLGFKIVADPLVTYVEGRMNEMQMKVGEPDKAKTWALTLAENLSK